MFTTLSAKKFLRCYVHNSNWRAQHENQLAEVSFQLDLLVLLHVVIYLRQEGYAIGTVCLPVCLSVILWAGLLQM